MTDEHASRAIARRYPRTAPSPRMPVGGDGLWQGSTRLPNRQGEGPDKREEHRHQTVRMGRPNAAHRHHTVDTDTGGPGQSAKTAGRNDVRPVPPWPITWATGEGGAGRRHAKRWGAETDTDR